MVPDYKAQNLAPTRCWQVSGLTSLVGHQQRLGCFASDFAIRAVPCPLPLGPNEPTEWMPVLDWRRVVPRCVKVREGSEAGSATQNLESGRIHRIRTAERLPRKDLKIQGIAVGAALSERASVNQFSQPTNFGCEQCCAP